MTTPNMTSVRLTLLNAILVAFQQMQADQPPNDPYGVTFSTVGLGPLADFDQRKRYSLGLVPGTERETYLYPYVQCWMQLNVEFRVTVNRNDSSPGMMIEQLLTVVKRRLIQDRTWGGLAIDTKVLNSEIDLETYADRSAEGVCVAEIQYRYSYLDPRNPSPAI